MRTCSLPYHEDHRKTVFVAEDDPEKFFQRPLADLEESDLLRWEIAVEALCEMTGERPVLDSLAVRAAADDE